MPYTVEINDLVVPAALADKINAAPGRRHSTKWLGTIQAAMYCAHATTRYDLDWHSILLENRRSEQRDQWDMASVLDNSSAADSRGNQHRYGELPTKKYAGKTYYQLIDLRLWLRQITPKLPPVKVYH